MALGRTGWMDKEAGRGMEMGGSREVEEVGYLVIIWKQKQIMSTKKDNLGIEIERILGMSLQIM